MKTTFLLFILIFATSCNQNFEEKKSVGDIDLSHTVENDRQRAINSLKKSLATPSINFSGTGNEPGWSLSIDTSEVEIIMNYGQDTIVDKYIAQEVFNSYVIELRNNPAIRITLIKNECFDDMTGEKSNTTIKMNWDNKTFYGCGNF